MERSRSNCSRGKAINITYIRVDFGNFANALIGTDKHTYIINTHMCHCHINLIKVL